MRSNKSEIFANLVLLGGILFCAALLCYSFYRLKIGADLAVMQKDNLKYYFICASGIFLCILLLRSPARIKINFALFIFSFFLAVYLGELAITVFVPRYIIELPPDKSYRAKAALREGVSFDTRTLLEMITDMRSSGIDAWPSLAPAQFLRTGGLTQGEDKIFPLAGISGKATVLGNESGEYVIYTADEHGFNNPAGLWGDKPDVVLIGDSFTHGECVREGETIAGLLRKKWAKTLNLGMRGSGPLIEYAIFREYVRPLKPKTVLWVYFGWAT